MPESPVGRASGEPRPVGAPIGRENNSWSESVAQILTIGPPVPWPPLQKAASRLPSGPTVNTGGLTQSRAASRSRWTKRENAPIPLANPLVRVHSVSPSQLRLPVTQHGHAKVHQSAATAGPDPGKD